MRTVMRLSVTVVVLAAAGYGLAATRFGPALSGTGVAQAAVTRTSAAPAVRPQSLTVATNAGQVFGRTVCRAAAGPAALAAAAAGAPLGRDTQRAVLRQPLRAAPQHERPAFRHRELPDH
jgi:hypothetical protein